MEMEVSKTKFPSNFILSFDEINGLENEKHFNAFSQAFLQFICCANLLYDLDCLLEIKKQLKIDIDELAIKELYFFDGPVFNFQMKISNNLYVFKINSDPVVFSIERKTEKKFFQWSFS